MSRSRHRKPLDKAPIEEASTAGRRPSRTARFSVGQLVHHRLFDYRGVVYDVDAIFNGEDDWYEQVARTRPPKDEPWYHVLPDGKEHTTYVAERNLESDPDDRPIEHELIDVYFEGFTGGAYSPRREAN